MPLEIRCTNCGKTLRVGDEHAGKQVRCPACQQISVAPAAAGAAGQPGGSTGSTWHMRTPEGQTYGPVAWSQIQHWAGEGRLAADCFVAESPAGPWRGAAELFPSLTPQRPAPVAVPPPTTHTWLPPDAVGDETAPFAAAYAPFTPGAAAAGQYTAPHRGGLILVLGLLGFMINCPIFCFMAWVMGSSDLREMKAGRMDKSGEQLTQVGRVLGMILSIFWIIAFVIFGFIILIAAVNGQ
jgi:phage FluMu protein Com